MLENMSRTLSAEHTKIRRESGKVAFLTFFAKVMRFLYMSSSSVDRWIRDTRFLKSLYP